MIDTLEKATEMQLPDHGEPNNVFGRGAVVEYEREIFYEHQYSYPHDSKEFWLNKNLKAYRDGLNNLVKDTEANKAIDTYFDSFTTLPPILKNAKSKAVEAAGLRHQGSRGALTWSEWLADEASDEQLLNFLQWHNHTHENRSDDPEIRALTERLKEEYEAMIIPLITTGYFHMDALFARSRLKYFELKFSDIFNAYLTTMMGGVYPDTKEIEFSEDAPTGHPQTVWHEFNHAGLGEYEDRDKNSWIDEALAEHISLALQFGGWDIVDPDKRKEKAQFYSLERKLLARLTEMVPIQLFTRYYSAMTKESKEYTRADLDNALERATGESNVLNKISDFLFYRSNNAMTDDEIDTDYDEYNAALKDLADDPSIAWSFAYSAEGTSSNL